MSLKDATSIEKLGAGNYATWSTDVKWALIMKGLWDAIDDAENVEAADDLKALAFIGLTVERHIKPTVDACDTAREAWDKLENKYKAQSSAFKLKLKKDLINLELKPKEDITSYVARAVAIRDQLTAAGMDVEAQELCLAVLGGLPEDYTPMVDAILTTGGELDLDDLIPKMMVVEQRVKERWMRNNSTVKVFAASDDEKTCWHCGKKGHIRRNCTARIGLIPGETKVYIPPKNRRGCAASYTAVVAL